MSSSSRPSPLLSRPAAEFRSFGTRAGGGDDDGGSGGGGNRGDDEKKPAADIVDDDEDPFGVNYENGTHETGNVGPESSMPPAYKRDPHTGKFTGEIASSSSSDPADVASSRAKLEELKAMDLEAGIAERFVSSWNDDERDELGDSKAQATLASRIREEEAAMNVFGRRPVVRGSSSGDGEEGEGGTAKKKGDGKEFTSPLTEEEYATLKKYIRKKTSPTASAAAADADDSMAVDDLDLDGVPVARSTGDGSERAAEQSDNPDLDLTWLTTAAKREMDDPSSDPFLDLLPHDLTPATKVNRRRAKLLPREILHHNNLSLLRRYVTPGGQIMNRVQSRLGAKDQRKIAKLVKRARHLGLVPHHGQWKFEDHGFLHEKDIEEDRAWEKELIERGFVNWDKLRKDGGKKSAGGA